MKPICREALPLLRRTFQTVCIRSITHNRSPLNAILKIVYPFLARLRIKPDCHAQPDCQGDGKDECKYCGGIIHRLVCDANNYIKQHITFSFIVYCFFLLSLHRNSTSGCGIRPILH